MHLENYKNYLMYADMVKNHEKKIVYVPKEITRDTIDDHITAITNILKDGIETEYVHNTKITISWGGDLECDLSIIDYWFNLFMWSMVLKTNTPIEPKHIFWQKDLKRYNLKEYVDNFIITKENRINIDSRELNSIICDALYKFSEIEQFSYYLANTINNEDDIALMEANPEFYDLLHCSLQGVPFDDVKEAGMNITNRAIDIIKNSKKYIGYDHGLTNSFRANEAINPRQFKEASLNIGTKPNGMGTVYPYIIDKSFKTGGVNDPLSYFIESSTARAAQIMSKTNVGDSGNFARLLGLNNTDTILNLNRAYECMSRHFMKYEIKTSKHLSMIKNRYYRFNPLGMEYLVDDKDTSLIGKTIYMRSPMTCASNSAGNGICKKCYGDLYYTNLNINVGKLAAEILTSILTQILLSAKHLFETKIIKIQWNEEFSDFFDIDINSIKLSDGICDDAMLKKYTLIIDPEDVILDDDEEEQSYSDDEDAININDTISYNEYITKFIIRTPVGEEIEFGSQDQDPLYISNELNKIIRKKASNANGKVNIPLSALGDDILFFIKINNNEISKTMNDIIKLINNAQSIEGKTKDEVLQTLVDLVIEGGLNIDSVHLEVILSNQIVSAESIIKKPNWNDPYVQYRMLTLNQALTNNPSVVVSLLYKDLGRTLYNPLTFTKNAPSFFDLFFCEQPQNYISDELLTDDSGIETPDKKLVVIKRVDNTKKRND